MNLCNYGNLIDIWHCISFKVYNAMVWYVYSYIVTIKLVNVLIVT